MRRLLAATSFLRMHLSNAIIVYTVATIGMAVLHLIDRYQIFNDCLMCLDFLEPIDFVHIFASIIPLLGALLCALRIYPHHNPTTISGVALRWRPFQISVYNPLYLFVLLESLGLVIYAADTVLIYISNIVNA